MRSGHSLGAQAGPGCARSNKLMLLIYGKGSPSQGLFAKMILRQPTLDFFSVRTDVS